MIVLFTCFISYLHQVVLLLTYLHGWGTTKHPAGNRLGASTAHGGLHTFIHPYMHCMPCKVKQCLTFVSLYFELLGGSVRCGFLGAVAAAWGAVCSEAHDGPASRCLFR
jgi:hypothetical protein